MKHLLYGIVFSYFLNLDVLREDRNSPDLHDSHDWVRVTAYQIPHPSTTTFHSILKSSAEESWGRWTYSPLSPH